ncbi:MAG: hypothetical protein ACI9J2_001325 [Saprospiraceae bacterium]|jgi:hypothetical protein
MTVTGFMAGDSYMNLANAHNRGHRMVCSLNNSKGRATVSVWPFQPVENSGSLGVTAFLD